MMSEFVDQGLLDLLFPLINGGLSQELSERSVIKEDHIAQTGILDVLAH